MSLHSLAWLIYGVFLLYLWIVAITAWIRYKRDPHWTPRVLADYERALGIRLSTRGYAALLLLAAILGSIGSLWIPRLCISILERRL